MGAVKHILTWTGQKYEPIKLEDIPVGVNFMIMVVDEVGPALDLDALGRFFNERRQQATRKPVKPIHSLYVVRKTDIPDGGSKKSETS